MRTKNLVRRVNILAVLVFLFALAVQIVFSKVHIVNTNLKYIISTIMTVAMFLVPTLIIIKSQSVKPKKFLTPKRFKLRWLPLIIVSSLTATLGGILLNALMLTLKLPSWLVSTSSNIDIKGNYLLIILSVVIVPAIFEELFFRGAMLKIYSKRGKTVAIIASSVLFALLHGTPVNFFGPLIAGLVYGFLVIIFDSIYPAIIAHLINNALTSAALFYYSRFLDIGISSLFITIAVIMFFVLLYLSLRLVEPYIGSIKPTEKPSGLSERLKYNENSAPVDIYFGIVGVIWVVKLALNAFGVI